MPILVALCTALLSAAQPAQRFAVVVGANEAPAGRQDLRFAHLDAQQMAEVLVRTGEFSRSQVLVLLDPEPGEVLRALDEKLALASKATERTLLLFYYSGHADTEALFPAGKALPLEEVRRRLESSAATVRIGIVDACRGGGWTRSKGVTAEAPLQIRAPLELSSEGSILLGSSSGLESAHESEALSGSFFTHHLVAGLRGAADRNGDGEVTLGEVFAYAKELTVRDSVLQSEAPQHPSFLVNLSGRSDLPLARVGSGEGVVELQQDEGPLQVVQLTTGLVMLELPPGKRDVRVAVPPGRYLVRSKGAQGIRGREIAVEGDRSALVEEANLTLVGSDRIAVKAPGASGTLFTTLPRGTLELGGSAGKSGIDPWLYPSPGGIAYQSGTVVGPVHFSAGLTDRLEFSLPFTFAYRLGQRSDTEAIGWAGSTYLTRQADIDGWAFGLGAGVGVRKWLGPGSALDVAAQLHSTGFYGENFGNDLVPPRSHPHPIGPELLNGTIGIGLSHTFRGLLTLNLGVNFATLAAVIPPVQPDAAERHPSLGLGAVRLNGTRASPLLRLHLRRGISLDFDAGFWWDLTTNPVRSSTGYALGGFTWTL